MKKLLTPDHAFKSIADLTPDFFKEKGIKAVFLDIDNTLVTPHSPVPDEKCDKFVLSLKNSGITVCLVSNNKKKRVDRFNTYGVYSSYRSAKPLPFCYLKLIKKLGISENQAAAVGDQFFSDIMGANSIGMLTVYISPIKIGGEGAFVWLKRKLELPILKKLEKNDLFYGKNV